MGALEGRIAIITGGAGGLGREYAKLFAAEGAKVVVNDLGTDRSGQGSDPSVAQGVVDEITAAGGEAVANSDDVSTMDGAQRLMEQALDAYGDLHVLVNSGGMLRDRMFVSMTADEWDAIIGGHLRAHFCPSNLAARHWRERTKAGADVSAAIVNTSSNAGLLAQPGQSNYAAAKAGIAGLTITLAEELSRYGVRVNAISPAARSRMTTEVEGMAEMVAPPSEPGAFDVYHPGNVAPLVAYLATEACPLTGRVFYVQGGEVRLMEGWHYAETLEKDGRWSVAELAQELKRFA